MDDRIPDELQRFVRAERARPELSPGARARLLARVASTRDAADMGISGRGARAWGVKKAVLLGATSLISFGAGWVSRALVMEAPIRMVIVEKLSDKQSEETRPVAESEPVANSAAPNASRVAPSVPPTGVAPAPLHAATSVPSSDSELAKERVLLNVAHAALARGNVQGTFDAIQEHGRAFPRGRLSEERDMLRVLAEARAQNRDRARSELDAFERRYPRSVFLTTLREAVGR